MLADPAVRQRGLSRTQYDALVDAGALEVEPVELVEGVLVEVVPQGPQHEEVVEVLDHRLVRRLPDPWRVRVQMSLPGPTPPSPSPTSRSPSGSAGVGRTPRPWWSRSP